MSSRLHTWFLLIAIGCGGGEDGGEGEGGGTSERCNIGDSRPCDCAGITRRQLCRADGSGFEPCPCGTGSGSQGGGIALGGTGAGTPTGGFNTGAVNTGGAATGGLGSGGSAATIATGGAGGGTTAPAIVREYCAFFCQMNIERGCPAAPSTCQQDCTTSRTSEFTRKAACATELEAYYRCVMSLPVDAFYCDAGIAAPQGTTHCAAELTAFQDCDRNQ